MTSIASRRPTAVDLFSGAGGLSLGFEMAGFDVLAAVEYDPVHAATHLHNFPSTEILCRDVKHLRGEDILRAAERGWKMHYPGVPWPGQVDAVIGGPSCQGFSTIGHRNEDDDRNELVLHFVRLVEEIRPRVLCMENVPGFLHERYAGIRHEALGRLESVGYRLTGTDTILRAEDFGVPQRRRRVVILGALGPVEPEHPRPTVPVPFTVRDAFAGLDGLGLRPLHSDGESLSLTEKETAAMDQAPYLRFGSLRGARDAWFGHPRTTDLSVLHGLRPTAHSPQTRERFISTAQGAKEPRSRYFKLDPAMPALTLRAGTGRERGSFSAARPIHPTEPRVINVREAARLHSFPDWFRFHTTNWHAHRQIGNAVPPLLAAAVGQALLRSLRIEPQTSAIPALEISDRGLLALSPSEAAKFFDVKHDQVPPRRRGGTIALARRESNKEKASKNVA